MLKLTPFLYYPIAYFFTFKVIVTNNTAKHVDDDTKPVILIEAGQLAGSESTNLVLVLIQQLAACIEYEDMIKKVKWVILPCTNPDGLEYTRYVSTTYICQLQLRNLVLKRYLESNKQKAKVEKALNSTYYKYYFPFVHNLKYQHYLYLKAMLLSV